MKIRSKIRRKKGTNTTIDGVTYSFNDANDHICEVKDEKHIMKLLSIKEGYEPVGKVPGEVLAGMAGIEPEVLSDDA